MAWLTADRSERIGLFLFGMAAGLITAVLIHTC